MLSTMPELPDIQVYLDALEPRIVGHRVERVIVRSPFLVRTVDPPVSAIEGRRVTRLRRLGKRIVWALEDELFVVLHLMIAGRLAWSAKRGAKPPGKIGLAAFAFPGGTLLLSEAGSKKRASLHVLRGETALAAHDRGGLEVLACGRDEFAGALRRENHTLKRALTDQRLFSGIGNAYADEILLAARLSPLALTSKLDEQEIDRLHAATRETLETWIARLRDETGDGFPAPRRVTAFRPEFVAHGKYGEPCARCGTKIQRIRYAQTETNYCPRCQTGGRILADRSLSRLLKDDWPRTVEELED
jgi:formamidopyrimidine-DNA glycosylase